MYIFALTQVDFAEKVLRAERPVLVCFRSSVWLPGMKGARACSRFGNPVIIQVARQVADRVLVAEADVARVGIGQEWWGVKGVTFRKPLPILILFKDGKEVARRGVSLLQATQRQAVERIIEWVDLALARQLPREKSVRREGPLKRRVLRREELRQGVEEDEGKEGERGQ